MFNLAMRSVAVLGVLFGLLFAVLIAGLTVAELPTSVALPLALAVAIGISALQFAISPYILQWILKINWMPADAVDAKLGATLQRLCAERRLPVPRFGIIEDGNPNAFTFGHWPSDARLVMTRGLLDVCDDREREAVLAHELGHIVHWDFVVMTVAATVPLILYVIYRFALRGGSGNRRGGGAVLLVGIGAFVAYIISQYVVLFLSRVREYYADQFSAEVTRSPNALASALVKIAYGLARAEPAGADAKQKERSLVVAGGAKMLGIFDPKYGASMALASAGAYDASTQTYNPETATKAMRWDLWNPWALIAELSSSHPLPAKRIRQLQKLSELRGERPIYALPERPPESYWDEFATDLFFNYAPVLTFLVGGLATWVVTGGGEHAYPLVGAVAVGAWALGNLLRLGFAYPKGRFEESHVADLVGEVKVSQIRCLPAVLRGTIIGRGIPGLYWSQDLVVQDESGFMVMMYRQPLRLLEFLFGLFRAESFVGQQVVAQGWYRRFPSPYLELWKVQLPDGKVHTCHSWAARFWGTILIGVIAGFGCLYGVATLLGR